MRKTKPSEEGFSLFNHEAMDQVRKFHQLIPANMIKSLRYIPNFIGRNDPYTMHFIGERMRTCAS